MKPMTEEDLAQLRQVLSEPNLPTGHVVVDRTPGSDYAGRMMVDFAMLHMPDIFSPEERAQWLSRQRKEKGK